MSAPTLHVEHPEDRPNGLPRSAVAVGAPTPVLRVCAGRLVAPNRSTAHRTSAAAHSTVVVGGVRRPGNLQQLGASFH